MSRVDTPAGDTGFIDEYLPTMPLFNQDLGTPILPVTGDCSSSRRGGVEDHAVMSPITREEFMLEQTLDGDCRNLAETKPANIDFDEFRPPGSHCPT